MGKTLKVLEVKVQGFIDDTKASIKMIENRLVDLEAFMNQAKGCIDDNSDEIKELKKKI